MAACTFCVIKFEELPGEHVPDMVIVPSSWIICSRPPRVAYPQENFAATTDRAMTEELHNPEWKTFPIHCLFGCNTWEQASAYLKSITQDNSNASSNSITSDNRTTQVQNKPRRESAKVKASRKSLVEMIAEINKPQRQRASKKNIVRHPKLQEGLVELIPHSEVYGSEDLVKKICTVRKTCTDWVPILLKEVFTDDALAKYSYNDLKDSHEHQMTTVKMSVQNIAKGFGMKPMDDYYVWNTIKKVMEKHKTPSDNDNENTQ